MKLSVRPLRACHVALLTATVVIFAGCDQSTSTSSRPSKVAAADNSKTQTSVPTKTGLAAPAIRITAPTTAPTSRPISADSAADISGPVPLATRPAASAGNSANRWSGAHYSVALPDGWKAYDGVAPRIGTVMTAAGQQVAVLIFDGDAGGTLGNVNLWRRQIALRPAGESEMLNTNKRIEGEEGAFTLVDLQGPAQRMLGAVLPQSDRTVFLKMIGPFAAIEHDSEAFIELAKSLRIEERKE